MAITLRPSLALMCCLGLLVSLDIRVEAQEEGNKEAEMLVRLPALGRTARLGAMYNASTETFTEISILNKMYKPTLMTSVDTPSTNTKFGLMKAYSDKSSLLDVSASMTLSILSGKIDVKGSASYMQDEQKTSNSVVGSLVYETLTQEEVLEIFYDEMRDYISPAVLENATESHVVIGIGWGANVVVKFEDQNGSNKDITAVQGSMEVAIKFASFGVSGKADLNMTDSNMETFSDYSLQIYGDVNFDASDYPTDITRVINLIEKIPKLVDNSNDGKGKQLFFSLVPLQKVKDFFNFNGNKENTTQTPPFEPVPPAEVAAQIDVFEQISIVKLKLNDLYTTMMRNRDILNNTDLHQLHDLRNGFLNSTVTYRSKLRKGLTDYSSGRRRDIGVLRRIEQDMRSGDDSSLEVTENRIDLEFRDARLKVELVEFLRSEGAIWVGRSDSVMTSIVQVFKTRGVNFTICYIPFNSEEDLVNTPDFVTAVLVPLEENKIPLIVDCSFDHPLCSEEADPDKACLTLYEAPDRNSTTEGEDTTTEPTDSAETTTSQTFLGVQEELEGLKMEMQRMNKEEAIPVGFIYTELPGQSPPKEIWPQFEWTDKSGHFAGDFFRVVGGSSARFGDTQSSQSGGLSRVTTYKCALGSLFCSVYSSIEMAPNAAAGAETGPGKDSMPISSASKKIPVGPLTGSTVFVDFVVSSEESRPINKAVRIWERTA